MTMYRYHVVYRRDNASLDRKFHLSVTASDADDARRVVALADPHYLATVKSPQRWARVLVDAESHA